jgi:hypothetical protein
MCSCKGSCGCKSNEIKLRGPRGFQGPQGPPGPIGLSGCINLNWQNITLNNGWTTNGPQIYGESFQLPQYAINTCTNQVYLRGTFFILEGEPDPNTPAAFTLPVNARPQSVRFYPNQTMPATGFDNFGGSTFIAILPDGRVIPSEVAGTVANALLYYCLDGIVFETN